MNARSTYLLLPLADAPAPHSDRRIPSPLSGYPWLVQQFPRSPLADDTLVPEDWPDLGPILDLMDL